MNDRPTLPDPTGNSPRYQTANDIRNIYRANMVVAFIHGGIFLDSVKIVSATNDADVWTRGIDWDIDETCYDDYATSEALNADPSFAKTLINKLLIKTARPLPIRVVLSYQNYWDVNRWNIPGIGDPLQFDPDMLSYLLSTTAKLTQQVATVQSVTSASDAVPAFYPEDIHEENPANVIAKETHSVNTSTGMVLIQPVNGPFFRDSVGLSINGTALVEGTDYEVDSLDIIRTKRSRNTSGIYRGILIISPQAGSVDITYHAVGGVITQSDYQAMWDRQQDIITFLNGMDIVTGDTLSLTPIMKTVLWRLDQQDEKMRRLLANPNPSNATSGVSVQKVFTATDSKLHWFDIATLYKVVDGGPTVVADCFKGRVFLPGLNVAWTFTVEANLNQAAEPFTFSTQSLLVNPGVASDGTLSTTTPVYPILRAVWNSLTSGIILQIGLANPNLTENPVIEDLSTAESCWILDQSNPVIAGQPAPASTVVHDSGFVLPDGASVWIGTNVSKAALYFPPKKDGYLFFAGKSDYLKNIVNSTWTEDAAFAYEGVPVEQFKKAIIVIGDDSGNVWTATADLIAQAEVNGVSRVVGVGSVYVGPAQQNARVVLTFSKSDTEFLMDFALSGSVDAGNTLSVRSVSINT